MAYFLCFFRTSKSLIPLVIVICAVLSSFSMSLSALLIMFSTLVFFKFSERKAMVRDEESHQEAEAADSRSSHWSLPQEQPPPAALEGLKTLFISSKVENKIEMLEGRPKEEEIRKGSFIIRSEDMDSECESRDEHSSSDSGHHSDIEWLRNQARYFLDGSISDEESLIEIAIPSGHFVSLQEEAPYKLNLNCELSTKERSQEHHASGFMADTGDQEDNLIEIDICRGSIKYSKHYGAKDIHPTLVRNKLNLHVGN